MMLSRRDLIAKCLALGAVTTSSLLSHSELALAWQQRERKPTPPVELGPFYKKLAPQAHNLRQAGDPGMPLSVAGHVLNVRGSIVEAATIEIWQTNHLGQYDLNGYRYRTKLVAPKDGKYAFSSVMPGHYPGRVCQHIHYAVTAPGHKPLVTQLYFATDPVFEGNPDKNYTKDPLITSRELVRPVTITGGPNDIQAAVQFELVLEVL
jgi:protocatechuate 3,4-dioxygenase beta subunit